MALNTANRVRAEMAEVKRAIRGGLPVADALRDPRAQPMRVDAVLGAQAGWGARKVSRACRRVPVLEGKRVRELTVRQREALVALCSS
jgi:hypothetical protein